MEIVEVDAVVDHPQFFRRDAETAPDLVPHHVRIADHRAQARIFEHAALGGADVAMVGIERDAEALEGPGRSAPDVEPFRVHAVAGAVDAAAGDALVRLHQVEAASLPGLARGARERRVAPGITDVEGVDGEETPRAPAVGLARDQRQFRARALERRQRAFDEALGPAVGVVALPDQRQAHSVSAPGPAVPAPRRRPRPRPAW